MNTTTATFRGYGKLKQLTAQTAVECKFGQEVETVLSAHASAALTGADAGNGEVRYYGKVHFSIVYEDAEKRVCRAEKGVEFSATAKDDFCYPALAARAALVVENVAVRREGSSVYATALLGADISLFGEQNFEYLAGGDLIMKREPVTVLLAHLVTGTAEQDDEFETDYASDILQHTETVCIHDLLTETGILKVEGEINFCVLALKGNNLTSFERLVPFTLELPCEQATFGATAEAQVAVVDASLRADTDEEKGRCRLSAEFTLTAQGCVYEEVAIDAVTDAFSPTHVATLAFGMAESGGVGEMNCITERVSGKCALSGPLDFSDSLQAVTLQRAEANLADTQEGRRIEGVAMATLLVLGSDGSHRGIEISLPFSVETELVSGTVSVLVCGMSARQKQEGEIEAEATLKICTQEHRRTAARLVSGAEEGPALPAQDSAVSVYVPRAGDGLWELSKSLRKSPEEVSASNPDVEFPIKEGQRVIVYRRRTVS